MRNKSKIKAIIVNIGVIFALFNVSTYIFNNQDRTLEIRDEVNF